MATVDIDLGAYSLGWHDSEEEYVFKPRKGLDEDIIRQMSSMKGEPDWMLEFRLKSYQRFLARPMPTWGGDGALDEIDFDDIYYYVKPTEGQAKDWDMVPESIKDTYEKLGIPEAERLREFSQCSGFPCYVRKFARKKDPCSVAAIRQNRDFENGNSVYWLKNYCLLMSFGKKFATLGDCKNAKLIDML